MANPQWKNYQASSVNDPAILAFSQQKMNKSPNVVNGSVNYNGNNVNNSIRETGLVEKMLHSYGFIQCCDRDARLFFHFSECKGNAENLKVGDPVEFQMSFDRRTGKPIAVSLVKMEKGSVSFEILSENRVKGTCMVVAQPPNKSSSNTVETEGKLSYEQSGEFFFLSYSLDDVEDNATVCQDDQVSFFIGTDKRNNRQCARLVKLEAAVEKARVQGVICSMKDSYGFIERADAVKEIFFHFSEIKGNLDELKLGDDVDFHVQTRNGKEVAVDIQLLTSGTVIFEDMGVEYRRGKIKNTLKGPHGRHSTNPLSGLIVYETVKGPIEIPFGDKDQNGDYTLNEGDMVQFKIATDRRDQLQRATLIQVVDHTFKMNDEQRETGIVANTKDGYGFLRCADREARMFFHFSEIMEPACGKSDELSVRPGDEVEFTVVEDPNAANRLIAIRIRRLPKGSISFQSVHPQKLDGTVEKEPSSHKNNARNKDSDPGIIMYDVNGTKQMIPYSMKAVHGNMPKYGDKVEFQIEESKRNNTKTAVNVKLVSKKQSSNRQQGFIATLKEHFGFIEAAEHNTEVFFHFSNFEGEPGDIDIGDEVDFTLARKTNKVSAESIRKLKPGTVNPEEVKPGVLDGKIVRCMRIVNPEQTDYPGLVQVGDDDDPQKLIYSYGITSLADKRDFLQKGDVVKFQLAVVKATGELRATRIAAVRKCQRSRVDSIKGQFGFLQYEHEEGKKLFFHMTEVHDNVTLTAGDEVEFVVVQNQRNKKYSACSLRKISGGAASPSTPVEKKPRPERLISRLKSISDAGPRLQIIRQPRGPDSAPNKGFQPRQLRPDLYNSKAEALEDGLTITAGVAAFNLNDNEDEDSGGLAAAAAEAAATADII